MTEPRWVVGDRVVVIDKNSPWHGWGGRVTRLTHNWIHIGFGQRPPGTGTLSMGISLEGAELKISTPTRQPKDN